MQVHIQYTQAQSDMSSIYCYGMQVASTGANICGCVVEPLYKDTSLNQDIMHGPSYIKKVQIYPWNEDTSFSQDTLSCSYGTEGFHCMKVLRVISYDESSPSAFSG